MKTGIIGRLGGQDTFIRILTKHIWSEGALQSARGDIWGGQGPDDRLDRLARSTTPRNYHTSGEYVESARSARRR